LLKTVSNFGNLSRFQIELMDDLRNSSIVTRYGRHLNP
jgi:hypothetical protein